MTRSATLVDRLVALGVGILLIALGVGALLWNTTALPRIPTLVTARIGHRHRYLMGPWAVAVTGVLCLALGVRWLLAHPPGKGQSPCGRANRPTSAPSVWIWEPSPPPAASPSARTCTRPRAKPSSTAAPAPSS